MVLVKGLRSRSRYCWAGTDKVASRAVSTLAGRDLTAFVVSFASAMRHQVAELPIPKPIVTEYQRSLPNKRSVADTFSRSKTLALTHKSRDGNQLEKNVDLPRSSAKLRQLLNANSRPCQSMRSNPMYPERQDSSLSTKSIVIKVLC